MNIVSNTDGPINGHYNKGVVPFTFYGDIGANVTNARLIGIAELSSGVALVGSSAKSYSESFKKEKQHIFLQVIDTDSGESVLSGSTRPGTEDKGIIWLTDYTDGSVVKASAVAALDKSRLIIMWERWRNNIFVNSYYSIISSDGKILREAIPMQKARINGAEELKIIGDKAYWIFADGDNTAEIYRLDTSTISTNILKESEITLSWTEAEYTGKALKPTVTVRYGIKALKKDTDYTVSYKNNTKIGIASVILKCKGTYSGTHTVNFYITPKAVQNFSLKRSTNSKNTFTWSKSKYASGYEISINKYEKCGDDCYGFSKEVTKTTSKTTFTHIAGTNSNVIFYYKVRPYVIVNDQKIYGKWSNSINPYR